MASPTHCLRLTSTTLEGLDGARQRAVEAELQALIPALEQADLNLAHPVDLHVVITDSMEQHVDRIRKQHGAVDAAPYDRTRLTVSATGITLVAPNRPPLSCHVILAVDAWAASDVESLALRNYLLCHELGHVLQHGQGRGIDYRQRSSSNEEEMLRTAKIIREEFDADSTADALCRLMLRDDQGKAFGPGHLLAPQFASASLDILTKLCDFALEVQRYREIGTDELLDRLYRNAGPLLGETVLLLTHTIALYLSARDLAPLSEQLAKSPGFKCYIEPDWNDFLEDLVSKDEGAAERRISEFLGNVLYRLGLRIEDRPGQAPYVHVHEPIFCNT